MDNGIRLNKYIKDSGYCSRREADQYIERGVASVNGSKGTLETMVYPGDRVHVNGVLIEPERQMIYLAFHKPAGITCTTNRDDPTNIIDYIRYPKRIYPIGRIDKDSEGLILLTNHGDIVNRILRAGNAHEKEYIVTVNRKITDHFIQKMSQGVPIHRTVTLPCEVQRIKANAFSIILKQGLNRQIRLMCQALGYEVVALKRTRIMNITLKGIEAGAYRELTPKEVKQLLEMTKHSSKTEEASKMHGRKGKPQSKKNPSVRYAKNGQKFKGKPSSKKKKLDRNNRKKQGKPRVN